MNKKAIELSMNLIIITVIALLVLVVVIYIFGSRSSQFSTGLSDCATKQGSCVLSSSSCPGPIISGTSCEKDSKGEPTGKVCCVKI